MKDYLDFKEKQKGYNVIMLIYVSAYLTEQFAYFVQFNYFL